VIRVEGFSKKYGDFAAVRDLDFEVRPGSILGLVGANGAGKTTTLRTLSGIVAPTAGRLSIAGHDVVHDSVRAKLSLGYIPDDPRLFDTLTVWEHLAFTAAAYRVAEFETTAESLLQLFELSTKRDTPAHSLSRGMRQKVAIACAYLHTPKALLFDEPLTGLDPQGIQTIQTSLREKARDGTAIVISSHLLSLVEELCTHVLVLDQGQCLWFGPIEEALQMSAGARGTTSLEEAFFRLTGRGEQE
jgi:ABC-2 type transport system ATP-binding protein